MEKGKKTRPRASSKSENSRDKKKKVTEKDVAKMKEVQQNKFEIESIFDEEDNFSKKKNDEKKRKKKPKIADEDLLSNENIENDDLESDSSISGLSNESSENSVIFTKEILKKKKKPIKIDDDSKLVKSNVETKSFKKSDDSSESFSDVVKKNIKKKFQKKKTTTLDDVEKSEKDVSSIEDKEDSSFSNNKASGSRKQKNKKNKKKTQSQLEAEKEATEILFGTKSPYKSDGGFTETPRRSSRTIKPKIDNNFSYGSDGKKVFTSKELNLPPIVDQFLNDEPMENIFENLEDINPKFEKENTYFSDSEESLYSKNQKKIKKKNNNKKKNFYSNASESEKKSVSLENKSISSENKAISSENKKIHSKEKVLPGNTFSESAEDKDVEMKDNFADESEISDLENEFSESDSKSSKGKGKQSISDSSEREEETIPASNENKVDTEAGFVPFYDSDGVLPRHAKEHKIRLDFNIQCLKDLINKKKKLIYITDNTQIDSKTIDLNLQKEKIDTLKNEYKKLPKKERKIKYKETNKELKKLKNEFESIKRSLELLIEDKKEMDTENAALNTEIERANSHLDDIERHLPLSPQTSIRINNFFDKNYFFDYSSLLVEEKKEEEILDNHQKNFFTLPEDTFVPLVFEIVSKKYKRLEVDNKIKTFITQNKILNDFDYDARRIWDDNNPTTIFGFEIASRDAFKIISFVTHKKLAKYLDKKDLLDLEIKINYVSMSNLRIDVADLEIYKRNVTEAIFGRYGTKIKEVRFFYNDQNSWGTAGIYTHKMKHISEIQRDGQIQIGDFWYPLSYSRTDHLRTIVCNPLARGLGTPRILIPRFANLDVRMGIDYQRIDMIFFKQNDPKDTKNKTFACKIVCVNIDQKNRTLKKLLDNHQTNKQIAHSRAQHRVIVKSEGNNISISNPINIFKISTSSKKKLKEFKNLVNCISIKYSLNFTRAFNFFLQSFLNTVKNKSIHNNMSNTLLVRKSQQMTLLYGFNLSKLLIKILPLSITNIQSLNLLKKMITNKSYINCYICKPEYSTFKTNTLEFKTTQTDENKSRIYTKNPINDKRNKINTETNLIKQKYIKLCILNKIFKFNTEQKIQAIYDKITSYPDIYLLYKNKPLNKIKLIKDYNFQNYGKIEIEVKIKGGSQINCSCKKVDSGTMIQCDTCHKWYHMRCVNLDSKLIENLPELYCCPSCTPVNEIKNNVRIASLNIQKGCVTGFKIHELAKQMNIHSIDIICIQEINIKEKKIESFNRYNKYGKTLKVIQLNSQNHTEISKIRDKNKDTDNDSNYVGILFNSKFDELVTIKDIPNLRMQIIDLKLISQNIRIFNTYIPPDSRHIQLKFSKLLIKEIKKNININSKFIVLGDFNCTSNFMDSKNNKIKNYKVIQNFMNKLNLIDSFRFTNPNLIKYSRKKRRIDYVFCSSNLIEVIRNANIMNNSIIKSDHNICYVDLSLNIKNHKFEKIEYIRESKIKILDKKSSEEQIKKYSTEIDKITNLNWEEDQKRITEIGYECLETKEYKYNGNKPNHFKKEKNILKIRKKRSNNIIREINVLKQNKNKNKYQNLNNKINNYLKNYEKDTSLYVENKISSRRKCKSFFKNQIKKIDNLRNNLKSKNENKIVKNNVNKLRKGIQYNKDLIYKTLFNRDRIMIEEIQEIQNDTISFSSDPETVRDKIHKDWSKTFTSKGEKPDYTPKHLKIIRNNNNLKFNNELTDIITFSEFEECLNNLHPDKSPGIDEITIRMIKLWSKDFKNKVIIEFNKYIINENIPCNWKESIISLIYKNGSKHNPLNFRPITLNSCLQKIFSNILNKRFQKFLEKNNIPFHYQNGFRNNRSTNLCIKRLINTIKISNKKKKALFACFVDLEKAFDSIEHWSIKETFDYYGINNKFTNLILNYLKNSKTKILTKYGETEKINITRGVKQGDPLSPTIFMVVINTFLTSINDPDVDIICYADDIIILANTKKALIKCLKKLEHFVDYNNLKINKKKNKTVITKNKYAEEVNYKNYVETKNTDSYKYLGIYINFNLNWSFQENYIKEKYLNCVKAATFKPYISTNNKIELINCAANPIIAYSMQFIKYKDAFLNLLEKTVVNSLRNSISLTKYSSRRFWNHFRGLDSLKTLNISTFVNTKLMVMNRFPKITLENELFLKEKLPMSSKLIKAPKIPLINHLLFEYDLSIVDTNPKNKYIYPFVFNNKIKKKIQDKSWKLSLNEDGSIKKYLNPDKISVLKQLKNEFDTENDIKEILNKNSFLNRNKKKEFIPKINTIFEENIDKFTIINNTVYVGTDGSIQNSKGYSSAFFGENNPMNTVFESYNFNISSAKTESNPILLVLKNIPNNYNICIFTDSKSTKKSISNFKKWSTKKKEKSPLTPAINLIHKEIKIKKKNNCTIKIHHIYSHVPEKIKKYKKDTAKLQKFKIKLQKKKEKLGHLFYLGMFLNIGADRIINDNTYFKKLPINNLNVTLGYPDFVLYDEEKGPIAGNSFKITKNKINKSEKQKWLNEERTKELKLINNNEIHEISYLPLTSKKKKFENFGGIYTKIILNSLPTKNRMKKKLDKGNLGNNLSKKKKDDLKKRYKNNFCNYCFKEKKITIKETTNHIFSSCPKNIKTNNKNFEEIKKVINKDKEILNSVNFWQNITEECYNKNKSIFDKGMLPNDIDIIINQMNCTKEKKKNVLEKVILITAKNTKKKWIKRNETIYPLTENQKLRRKRFKIRNRRIKKKKKNA